MASRRQRLKNAVRGIVEPPSTVLTQAEFQQLLRRGRSTFYAWKAAGLLNHLESPLPHLYIRSRVNDFLSMVPPRRGRPLRRRIA